MKDNKFLVGDLAEVYSKKHGKWQLCVVTKAHVDEDSGVEKYNRLTPSSPLSHVVTGCLTLLVMYG